MKLLPLSSLAQNNNKELTAQSGTLATTALSIEDVLINVKGGSNGKKPASTNTISNVATANITQEMRKEREREGEMSENVRTTTTAEGLEVSILPPVSPIKFDSDVLSAYSQTQGTMSLDTVSEIDTAPMEKLKKEKKGSVLPPTNLLTAEKVREPVPPPQRAIPISDAIFCENMISEGPLTLPARKSDLEMEFISELIMDVMSIVNRSGNTNIELKIALDTEASGLPNVKFELIPKAPVTNSIERLNRAYAQNAKGKGVPFNYYKSGTTNTEVSNGRMNYFNRT
ncbi:hypothetical protein KIN20_010777 [Parelaphostrongylus tenuis]|uniref:Uncharacterized protein n=1 Tax=Parelaphostrongylus tenuis TaxID=148309 RepID=A0AAD5M8D8_PARTN|nr:hypothetical protein KIN20_010777 [Parelaphostrongylus tenuis]